MQILINFSERNMWITHKKAKKCSVFIFLDKGLFIQLSSSKEVREAVMLLKKPKGYSKLLLSQISAKVKAKWKASILEPMPI